MILRQQEGYGWSVGVADRSQHGARNACATEEVVVIIAVRRPALVGEGLVNPEAVVGDIAQRLDRDRKA